MKIAIEPGVELDRAVAEASGLDVPLWASDLPRPSTDLNAAFAAAERVGVFLDNWALKIWGEKKPLISPQN